MKILFCGKDHFSYHRTSVILKGIEKHNDIIAEKLTLSGRDKTNADKLKSLSTNCDFVFVPAFRHKDVAWVKKHSKAPVVFDPLISEYLTKVVDYGQWYKAPTKYLLDAKAFRHADLLIADTQEMKKYYSRFLHYPESRIAVIPVGFISDDFVPAENQGNDGLFHAGFYGSFVPLQGTDVIAEAAFLLKKENIVIDIIGNGTTYKDFLARIKKNDLSNIRLHGWLPYNQLSDMFSIFDVALGIFGRSGKAKRVIPNKLFHYAAMNRCIITRESDAIREIFTPGENIVTISPTAGNLAETLLRLKNNIDDKNEIAQKGHDLIREMYNELKIADRLFSFLSDKQNSF